MGIFLNFQVDEFNQLVAKFDSNDEILAKVSDHGFNLSNIVIIRSFLLKYYHELVDSWVRRGKLRYHDYSSIVDELDDWWLLEHSFLELARTCVNGNAAELDQLRQKISVNRLLKAYLHD